MLSCALSHIRTPLRRLILVAAVFLCAAALVIGAAQDTRHLRDFMYGILIGIPVLALIRPAVNRIAGLGRRGALLLLTLLCLAVKLFWVLYVHIPPAGDYAVYWGYANSLSRSKMIWGGRYMALFPHLFGYAQFLSVFLSVFGSKLWLPALLNVLLSVCSGWLLFQLALRQYGLRGAVWTFLLWIGCPSQTIYNSLVLSEPLYTAMVLAFLLGAAQLEHRPQLSGKPLRSGILWGAGGGVLLRLIQGTRPIAAILIIALLLWLFLLRSADADQPCFPRFRVIFTAVLLAVYLLSGVLWNGLITWRIGESPSSTPGYSVLVGLNQASGGRWNQGDSDRLYSYSAQNNSTAQWAQEQALSDAICRLRQGDINFFQLFTQKLKYFMGSDDSCVGYSSTVLRHTKFFSSLCNAWFYLILLAAAIGALGLWHERSAGVWIVIPLYLIGLILAQMLVEVAGRYHYSLIPMLILLAQPVLLRDTGQTGPGLRKRRSGAQ